MQCKARIWPSRKKDTHVAFDLVGFDDFDRNNEVQPTKQALIAFFFARVVECETAEFNVVLNGISQFDFEFYCSWFI